VENPFKANPFKNLSKPQLYAVGVGGAGVLGFLIIHHHSSTGSWNPFSKAPAGNGGAIDPVTGMAYSQDNVTDPLTGETYLAEAEQYGSVQTAESSVSAYGQSSGGGSGIPVQPASGGNGAVNVVPGGVASQTYADDQAWSQAAVTGLSSIGYNSTDVASALGVYLAGGQLTPAQANLVNTALSEYPIPVKLPVILAPVGQPGPGPSPAGPTVSNGHVISSGTDHASVGWTGVNAVKYQTRISGPGKINGQVGTVTKPEASFTGLESGHHYEVTVTPYNASGKSGATGSIDFETTAPAKKAA
jgi:hypothetical protein